MMDSDSLSTTTTIKRMKQTCPSPLFPVYVCCPQCPLHPKPNTSWPGKLLYALQESGLLHSITGHSCNIVHVPLILFHLLMCLSVLLLCVLACHVSKYWASTPNEALFQEKVNSSVEVGIQTWLVPHRALAESPAPVAFQEVPRLCMSKWITEDGPRGFV